MKLPLYRRVLAALIMEEDVASQDEAEGRKSKDNDGLGYNQFMANLHLPSQSNFERFVVSSNTSSQMNYGFCENGLQARLAALSNGMDNSCDEEYLQNPIESKLLTELHSIGLYPDNVVCTLRKSMHLFKLRQHLFYALRVGDDLMLLANHMHEFVVDSFFFFW